MPMLMKNIYVGFFISLENITKKKKIAHFVYHLNSISDMLFPKIVSWLTPRKQRQLINAPYPHMYVIFRYF